MPLPPPPDFTLDSVIDAGPKPQTALQMQRTNQRAVPVRELPLPKLETLSPEAVMRQLVIDLSTHPDASMNTPIVGAGTDVQFRNIAATLIEAVGGKSPFSELAKGSPMEEVIQSADYRQNFDPLLMEPGMVSVPAAGAIGRGSLLRPLARLRTEAFNTGELVGQPIVDAISNSFDRLLPRKARELLARGEFAPTPLQRQAQRELRGGIEAAKERATNLMDDLIEALPDPESQRVARRIAEGSRAPEDLAAAVQDPNIAAAAQFVRDEFNRLGETMVRQGVGPYARLTDQGRDAIIAVMRGEMQPEALNAELRPFTQSGVAKYYNKYVPRLYRNLDKLKGKGAVDDILNKYQLTRNTVRQDLARVRHRGNLDPEVRKALGEIEEIVYPSAVGVFQEEKLIAQNKFFNRLASSPDLIADTVHEARPGMRPLPKTDTLGPLSGKYAAPSVYDDLVGIANGPREVGTIMRGMRWLNSKIKAGKTVWNPATHMRNWASNLILRDMGGMGYLDQAAFDPLALKQLTTTGDIYKEAREFGLFGTSFRELELDKSLVKITDDMPEELKAGMGQIAGKANWSRQIVEGFSDGLARAYQAEDDIPKLGMYMWLRKRGLNPTEAVDRVLSTLPDYSDVSPLLEMSRRNPIAPTFITFQAKVLPMMAGNVIKHPLRMGKYILAGELLSRISADFMGESNARQANEIAWLPDFMQPMGGVFNPFVKLPFYDSNGRSLYWDTTYLLPFGDLAERQGIGSLPSVFNFGIIPNAIGQAVFNENLYLTRLAGEPVTIWNNVTDTPWERGGKVATFLGQQLLPQLTPGVGLGAQRIARALRGEPYYPGDAPESVRSALLNTLTGVKIRHVDPAQEEEKRLREFDAELETLGANISSLNRSIAEVQANADIPRTTKRSMIRNLNDELGELINKQTKVLEERDARFDTAGR